MSFSSQNGPSGLGNYSSQSMSASADQFSATTNSNNSNSNYGTLPDTLPTTEQINRALAETGERERLKASLKARLWECGWHEQLKAECMNELRRRGVDKVGPHELVNLLGPRAKGTLCNL